MREGRRVVLITVSDDSSKWKREEIGKERVAVDDGVVDEMHSWCGVAARHLSV